MPADGAPHPDISSDSQAGSSPPPAAVPSHQPILAFELRVPTPPSAAQIRAAKVDRWAHRRAEPRPLAVLWMVYLVAASVLTIGAQGVLGLIAPDVYRPGARILLAAGGAGVAILWPMIRLSQLVPARPVRAKVLDAFVIAGPLNAIIWPQALPWMAGWSPAVCAILSLLFTGWVLLVAGLLILAMGNQDRDRDHPAPWVPRTAWMVVFVFLAVASPLLHGLGSLGAATNPREVWTPALFSPISAVFEITKDRTWMGVTAAALPEHWRAAWITLGLGLLLLLVAARFPGRAGVKTLPAQSQEMG